MKRLLTILALLCAVSAPSAEIITATVTVTNFSGTATNGTDTIVVNGVTRTWTNLTAVNPSAFILGTNNMLRAFTNTFNQFSLYPWANLSLKTNTTNSLKLTGLPGGALAASVGGVWGTISLSTNSTATNTYDVRVPLSSYGGSARTNVASGLIEATIYASNAVPPNSAAMTNYIGLTNVQTFGNKTITNSTLSLTSILHSVKMSFDNSDRLHFTSGAGFGTNYLAVSEDTASPGLYDATTGLAYTNATYTAYADFINWGTMLTLLPLVRSNYVTLAINTWGSTNIYTNVTSATVFRNGFLSTGAVVSASQQYGSNYVAADVGGLITNRAFVVNAGAGVNSNSVLIRPALTNASGEFSSLLATSLTAHAANISNANVVASSLTATNPQSYGGRSTNEAIDRPFLTNATLSGTHTLGGAIAIPRYDISTLANGNNIAVPFGSNSYIRLSGTLTASAAICGIVGSGSSGGTDGQFLDIFNDTGYAVTLAVNTADPVPANRLSTLSGADVTIEYPGWAKLHYDTSVARWRVKALWPVTATATNLPANFASLLVTNTVSASNFVIAINTLLVATNSTANSNLTINWDQGTQDIYATNNLSLTNQTGLATGTNKNTTLFITPLLVTRTIVYPTLGGASFGQRWFTNINSPMWTTLTAGNVYAVSLTARGTNVHATISEWK